MATGATAKTGVQASRAAGAVLPAEVASRLPDWGQRLARIGELSRAEGETAKYLKWELGREINEALGRRGSREKRTPLLVRIADGLGCSRPHLHNLVAVARAWPDRLPDHAWPFLLALLPHPQAERDRLLADLPPDAPASAVPRPRRDLSPEVGAKRRASRQNTDLEDAARQAFDQLPIESKVTLLVEWLRSFDAGALAGNPSLALLIRPVCGAASALGEILSGPAPAGRDPSDPHDRPSG